MAINDTSTETMNIYDAAECLQGPEETEVWLKLRNGSEIKLLSLTNVHLIQLLHMCDRLRENISLNPVKPRVCATHGLGKGAVKEAIDTLRRENRFCIGPLQ